MSFPLILAISLLAAALAAASARVLHTRTVIDGHVMAWASFIIAYPLSAVIHLVGAAGPQRGFHDLVRSPAGFMAQETYLALLLTFVALVAFWIGQTPRSRHPARPPVTMQIDVAPLLGVGALFTVLGLLGSLLLFQGVPEIAEAMATVQRDRELESGLARYYFVSRWLSWGLAFLVVAMLRTRLGDSKRFSAVLLSVAGLLLLGNLYWSGGRSEAIMGLVPVLLLIAHVRPALARVTVVFLGPLLLAYLEAVTSARVSESGTGERMLDVFDWHAGRFSMVGLGIEMAKAHGFAWGSTLLSGIADSINAPSYLLRIPPVLPSLQSFPSVASEYVRGEPLLPGIVPGTIAEFYYNFGVAGVGVGYFLIGRFTRLCARLMREARSMAGFSLAAYCLVLICTGIIPGCATAWVYSVLTLGVPLWFLAIVEAITRAGRARAGQPPVAAQGGAT